VDRDDLQMISNVVKEENAITTLVIATANGEEARELTEHELNTVAGGNWNIPEGVASPSA
jgi:bacteriocin-like protein